ncbi:MAG: helix-turn-helix protein [Actinomycetota bacterium]
MVLAGMKSSDLADEMGLGQMTIQRHMRGDTLPDLRQLSRYCDVLKCSPDYLFPRQAAAAANKWAPWGSNPQPTDCEDQFALLATG